MVSRARYRLAKSATRLNARVVVARASDLAFFSLHPAIRLRRLFFLWERVHLEDDRPEDDRPEDDRRRPFKQHAEELGS